MNRALASAQMLLGALCLLCFAGAFPLLPCPEVYRSGAMLCLGFAGMALALWGALRLAKGHYKRFLFGLVASFFAGAGVCIALECSSLSWGFIQEGGNALFAAATLACAALVGLLFFLVFGYLLLRVMTRRLWLAVAHVALLPLAFGAYFDFVAERSTAILVPVGPEVPALTEIPFPDGLRYPLGAELRLKKLTLLYHSPSAEGQPPAVQQYELDALVTDKRSTHPAVIRVNEPLMLGGWQLSLQSYRQVAGQTFVQLQARHAPGRRWALGGMIALIISIAAWCWWPKIPTDQKCDS